MKKYIFFILIINCSFAQTVLNKTWSTYCGGGYANSYSISLVGFMRIISSSVVDHQGNIIIVSSIYLKDEPSHYTQFTTPGCYQSTPIFSGINSSIVYIAKFAPSGTVLWATYCNVGNVRSVAVDDDNNIYFVGLVGSSVVNIATPGAYMENYTPFVGYVGNSFLTKLSSNGSLLWCTYIPAEMLNKVVYKNNSIYIAGTVRNIENATNPITTPGAYKEVFDYYNYYEFGVDYSFEQGYLMQFNLQGNRLYSTYLERGEFWDFDIDDDNNFIFTGQVAQEQGQTMGISVNSHQPEYGGRADGFIEKINLTTNTRLWSTFYGGSQLDSGYKILLDNQDIYIVGHTQSTNNIATAGCFEPTVKKTFIAKFTTAGVRQWGTYYGEPATASVIKMTISDIAIHNNKLYIASVAKNAGMATVGAYQDTYTPIVYAPHPSTILYAGIIAEFNLDGTRNWATYYNGAEPHNIKFSNFDGFYITGATGSATGISTVGAYQPNLIAATSGEGHYNMFISKFDFVPLSTTQFNETSFTLTPNPVQSNLTINSNTSAIINTIAIYNTLGQLVLQPNSNEVINILSLSTGNYIIKITTNEGVITKRFVKE
jgi:Secretion system C-terminal sorting domain